MGKLAPQVILILITLLLTTLPTEGAFATMEQEATIQYLPIGTVRYHSIEGVAATGGGDVNRRELAPFQLCVQCRCCTANDLNNCTSMPCCFGIDCNLPDKPYGVCAFVPKTCNCTSCS